MFEVLSSVFKGVQVIETCPPCFLRAYSGNIYGYDRSDPMLYTGESPKLALCCAGQNTTECGVEACGVLAHGVGAHKYEEVGRIGVVSNYRTTPHEAAPVSEVRRGAHVVAWRHSRLAPRSYRVRRMPSGHPMSRPVRVDEDLSHVGRVRTSRIRGV